MLEFCRHERELINLAVEQYEFAARYRPYRIGVRQAWPSAKARDAELTELRKATPRLQQGSRKAQVAALKIVDQAYQNWWKNPRHFRRPSFTSKHRVYGFSMVGAGTDYTVRRLNRHWGEVKPPKFKTGIRFRITRSWSEIAESRSARITCDAAGRWHIVFVGKPVERERTSTGKSVGIDRGVTNTIATSNNDFDHMPALTDGEKRRWLKLERSLARQREHRKQWERHIRSNNDRDTARQIISDAPLSNRYQANRLALGRLRCRLNNRRTNWIEQTTAGLVETYDVIVLENLQITNMVRSAKGTIEQPGRNVRAKAGLNRAILAQRWGEFAARLEQKADLSTSGAHIIYVPAAHTSQQCNNCDSPPRPENRENQAVFVCADCGHAAHADVNAAKNIHHRGIKLGAARGLRVAGREGQRTTSPPRKRQSNRPRIHPDAA